jgi:UDP-glucuronate 4-epimerase
MKILVTGAAGFIGYHLCQALLQHKHIVVGLDNINDYYDVNLKLDRLKELGIKRKEALVYNDMCKSEIHADAFSFVRMNLENRKDLPRLFEKENFDVVCNLAAQAGVRYSLENPDIYIDSNVVGFLNLLECCRNYEIKHLVYASSSSVYGLNKEIPFKVEHNVDRPISLYAATKKSNELMAHTYSHLFKLPTTGLRFFTVYGPWGRPDMAMFLFTDAISKNKPIKVFNNGLMERDFTYVDDIVNGLIHIIKEDIEKRNRRELYELFNIGNNNSVKLMDFISEIEKNLNKVAEKKMLPIQPGDVERTWADVGALIKTFDYKPSTSIQTGVKEYVDWHQNYYG